MQRMLESLVAKGSKNKRIDTRRYSLPEMISESYKILYACELGTNLYKLVESHLDDVRRNPKDIDRLSKQMSLIKSISRMVESNQLKDEDLVDKKDYDTVEPKEERSLSNDVRKDESVHDEEVEEKDDENLLEDTELTDEEVEELTRHLEEIRKSKKVSECDTKVSKEEPVEESSYDTGYAKGKFSWDINKDGLVSIYDKDGNVQGRFDSPEAAKEAGYELDETAKVVAGIKGRKLRKTMNEKTDLEPREFTLTLMINPEEDFENICKIIKDCIGEYTGYDVINCTILGEDTPVLDEKKTYESLNLSEFNKKSAGKAFMKTFKKLDSKLHEGAELTRQESISLYKAANSAMTHLSVELEHNPEFLSVFKESVSLLSVDVEKLLNSLKEGKAPSKANMKSLAKFSEALLKEEDEEGVEDPVIDDEEIMVSEEEEAFDQEYADARVELHKELADEFSGTEDPVVQEKLAQDVEEIAELPGVTEEQLAELSGEEIEVEETPEEDVEGEEAPEEEEAEDDITDDELAELKKHLTEMRKAKQSK